MAFHLNGYHGTQEIYASDRTLVYRARRSADDRAVILKVLNRDYPSPEEVSRFRREYDILCLLKGEAAPAALDLEKMDNSLALVLEDVGGDALANMLPRTQISLPRFLRLAIQVTEQLGAIHRHNLVHRDINPTNIVWNQEVGLVKIIDFGLARAIDGRDGEAMNEGVYEGTIAYMSPEQTGRMNRQIDYRADFYSLGATLYHCLLGHPPFRADSALQLIHAHLAQTPSAPSEIDEGIPSLLSDILLKLLAKSADERYHSAAGLIDDLQRCLQRMESGDLTASVALGEGDVPETLQISDYHYGRYLERETILAAFERTARGASELLLVSGPDGIGKTTLIGDVLPTLAEQGAICARGVVNPSQTASPFAALIEAVQSLMRQVLTGGSDEIEIWRDRLLAVLGPNAQVISRVAPELELIVGQRPDAPELSPAETQNRFNLVLQNLLRAFARRETPLVLVLDNLQWADGLMMRLIQQLVAAPDTNHLFVVGAYRGEEVDDVHPVAVTVDAIRRNGARATDLALQPLDVDLIKQLLTDTFYCPYDGADSLANLLESKTNGNPFFLREFLQALYANELIWFDPSSRCWRWELDKIEEHDIADNVVAIMIDRIRQLPQETQRSLQAASAIGPQFDLTALAQIEQTSADVLIPQLEDATHRGLIMATHEQNRYRFVHEDVRSATYSLIPEAARESLHLRVGLFLLEQTSDVRRDEKIVSIVNHLNLARSRITGQEARARLVELNLAAGKRAKQSGAYETSMRMFQVGLGLLVQDAWTEDYKLTLSLYTEATEAAYLVGDLEQMEWLATSVIDHARTLLDQVPVYEFEIKAYVAQNMPTRSVQTGLRVLELLGFGLPNDAEREEIDRRLLHTQQMLEQRSLEEIANLPPMTDQPALAAMRVMAAIAQAAYFSSPPLYPLLAAQQVELCLKYGDAPMTATVLGNYALILCSILGDLEAGYRYGKLALDILPDHPDVYAPKTIQVVSSTVLHWQDHLSATLEPSLRGYQLGLDRGDLETAAICAQMYCLRLYYLGRDLNEVAHEMSRYSSILLQIGQETMRQYIEITRQTVDNLLGHSPDPAVLSGNVYDIEEMLPRNMAANNRSGIFQIHFNAMILAYLFGDYDSAYEHGCLAEVDIDGARATPFVPIFYFYYALILLRVHDAAKEGNEAGNHLVKAKSFIAKMADWATHSPMNYAHKHDLMSAELDWIQGEDTRARDGYDRAIAGATQHGYSNEAALAYELAGIFQIERGMLHLGNYYLLNAHYVYQQRGATAKVRHLEQRHGPIFERRTGDVRSIATNITATHAEAVATIDLSSVIKASQVISGEIVLEKLLAQLLELVIENAGAQAGVLLLRQDERWVVEAEKSLDAREATTVRALPLGAPEAPALPRSLINYVTHTQSNVVLDNAATSDEFMRDPYIVARQPKSVLCAPLLNQGKLIGILYLENNLAAGVFTPDRLEVLNLLSSQAAISIENARLYATLEQQVEARTAELAQAILEADKARAVAEAANESKSTFLASVSHELRTPLTSILGFTSIIRKRLEERIFPGLAASDPRVARAVDQIESNIDIILAEGGRLTTLINNVLDLAKIEAGGVEWQMEALDITDVVEQAIAATMSLLEQNDLEMIVEVPESVARVIGDRDKLIQVTINLLSNAAKFTVEGSITCRVQSDAEEVTISVIDTGIGIAAADLASVFDKFKQVGDTLTDKPQGTGLGLSICREIVERHGGRIWVESKWGAGSCFTFSLPVATGTPSQ